MLVRTIVVTPFAQNCRILADELGGKATVVDPGGDLDQVLRAIGERELFIESIFLTHAHIDHVGGVAGLLRALEKRQGARPLLFAHPSEKQMRSRVTDQALMFGLSPEDYENSPEPDSYLEEGTPFSIGTLNGEVLFTPGHSPGHLSLYLPADVKRGESPTQLQRNEMLGVREFEPLVGPAVIAGDTLFSGSIGRTDLPGGNHELLLRSIQEKLLPLPENTRVLSGHGPDTTIGAEKRSNPFLTGDYSFT